MANMRKTDDFLRRLKKSGLEEAFNRLSDIAVDTIGCDLTDLIDDMVYEMENPAPELKAVWRVEYQDRWLAKNGKWMNLGNPYAEEGGSLTIFPTEDLAIRALNERIKECNQGARTQTTTVHGIGVDLVIDDDAARDMEIIHYKLLRQYRSKWETVDQG